MAVPGPEKPDILQVVQSAGVELRQRGERWWGCCPFHPEKTPSFAIDPEKQRWHCFGACGTGGDVIDFTMKLKGISFREAVSLLRIPDGLRGNREHKVDPQKERKRALSKAFGRWVDFTIRDLQDPLWMGNLIDSVITKPEHLEIAGLSEMYLNKEVVEYEFSVLTGNNPGAKVALYREGASCGMNRI